MTKKDFILAASVIKDRYAPDEDDRQAKDECIETFVEACQ